MRLACLRAALATITLGPACFPFGGGERGLDGPYYLGATDVPEQMALYRRVDDALGVQRVPPTVFAAGWDARHVIAKRHPAGDRARVEYYILDRGRDGVAREPAASVTGPLTAAEFATARRRLGVHPAVDFRVVLRDLE